MSTINNNYTDYSYLFSGSTSSTNESSSTSMYDLSSQLSSLGLYNSGYGTNTSSLSATQTKNVINLSSDASDVLSSIEKLMSKKNDGSSIFGSYSAESSDKDAFSATYKGDVGKYSSEALAARRDPNYKPAAPTDKAIRIDQVAVAQANTSNKLANSEMSFEANKTYTFDLTVDGKSKQISFSTTAADNNESVNKKIAEAVNGANAGVSAKIMSDDVTGSTYLRFESSQTGLAKGEDKAFEFSDVSNSGLADSLGLNNVTREAKNAIVQVGDLDKANSTDTSAAVSGESKTITSRSNDIAIDDKTTITAKKVTDDYTALNYKTDATDGINAIRDLVNSYNSLLESASGVSGSNAASRLQKQLTSLVSTYENSLSEIGITKTTEGYLKIDSDKMQKAADEGTLQKMFNTEDANANYGFANRLKTIAKSVESNPVQYAGEPTAAEASSSASSNDFSSNSSSSYSKLYFNMMKYENIGNLFNSMF